MISARESAVSSSPGRRSANDGRGGDTGDAQGQPFRGSEGEVQASPTFPAPQMVCAETGEHVEFRTPDDDYRTDARWRYASGAVCKHKHWVRETVPSPQIVTANPAFEDMVERRATRLCREAEPHAEEGPSCVPHLSEARRQLFDLYQQQESA